MDNLDKECVYCDKPRYMDGLCVDHWNAVVERNKDNAMRKMDPERWAIAAFKRRLKSLVIASRDGYLEIPDLKPEHDKGYAKAINSVLALIDQTD